ncbi:unnamed protein product [Amoebophrya sp. A25]|nr:unnamed protein product [Amoebophrya sp. A25]|eukprot:GSA25T00001488001.1
MCGALWFYTVDEADQALALHIIRKDKADTPQINVIQQQQPDDNEGEGSSGSENASSTTSATISGGSSSTSLRRRMQLMSRMAPSRRRGEQPEKSWSEDEKWVGSTSRTTRDRTLTHRRQAKK